MRFNILDTCSSHTTNMATQLGIMKSLLQAFSNIDATRLAEVTNTIQTLLAVEDNKFLFSMSFFVSYFNDEVKVGVTSTTILHRTERTCYEGCRKRSRSGTAQTLV
jgi:hypothetical protein